MISLAVVLVGLLVMKRQKLRIIQLSQCVELIQTIAAEISYGNHPIGEILQNAARNEAFSALDFLPHVAEGSLVGFAEEWKRRIETAPTLAMKTEEKAILIRFGKSLGTTDTQTQLILCERYRAQLNGKLTQAADHRAEYTRLTLGGTAVAALILFALML
ncbi:MAG: stage III sporulation protein AB [Clostridia bacterium]|nr:stage III sporulation protein AB [Clostridia bacterium]